MRKLPTQEEFEELTHGIRVGNSDHVKRRDADLADKAYAAALKFIADQSGRSGDQLLELELAHAKFEELKRLHLEAMAVLGARC